jgi:ABC-type uncharacterized transport system substrate-binding protein
VEFDVRSTGADEGKITPLAAALARENPDVIVAVGEKETRAVKAAAPQTPVVFVQIADPVAIGLVTSVARPGGRVTGVADLRSDLVPKRLELAKELMPNLRRVPLVYDAQDSESAAAARPAQETAPSLKISVVVRAVQTQEEAARELKTATARDVLLAPATHSLRIMELILNLNLYVELSFCGLAARRSRDHSQSPLGECQSRPAEARPPLGAVPSWSSAPLRATNPLTGRLSAL